VAGIRSLFNSPREGRRAFLIGGLAFRLYQVNSGKLRRVLRWLVQKLEGGTLYSLTLRRIFAAYHGVEVGMYSSMGCFVVNNYRPGTHIGRYCAIAHNSYSFTTDHPSDRKSIHSFFFNPHHGFVRGNPPEPTRLAIGNDVFIGHHVIILPSVSSIGDGAVIGAGSVVNTDIPPYAIAVGHPARVVRYRFPPSTIRTLREERWWEKSIDELLPELESFTRSLTGPGIRTGGERHPHTNRYTMGELHDCSCAGCR
jgi:acetyltransferase-like isoleucine patch superfamily enzyme